jgi:hypothetical protein
MSRTRSDAKATNSLSRGRNAYVFTPNYRDQSWQFSLTRVIDLENSESMESTEQFDDGQRGRVQR